MRGGMLGLVVDADEERHTAVMIPMSIIRSFLLAYDITLPEPKTVDVAPADKSFEIASQGFKRSLLDQVAPRLHRWMTKHGAFEPPPEMYVLHQYISKQMAEIEHDLADKTYIPLVGQDARIQAPREKFRPIRQAIRLITGMSDGRDAANSAVSALSRKSRAVRDLVGLITKSKQPIVLLGEPGAGKSITLRAAGSWLTRSIEHAPVCPS